MNCQILHGDCRVVLPTLADESVNCIVTSPPYFGLRDYGCAGQIGLESSPESYVAELVSVFRECRRVLRGDGVFWLNIGDSYAGSTNTGGKKSKNGSPKRVGAMNDAVRPIPDGIKPKDLVGIPWRVAFALQADGWYLRQDIIWHKPNPMPESVTDRCTKAHEYIFLLAKSPRYYYDNRAIVEPAQYGEQHANKATSWGTNRKHPNKANVSDYAFKGDNHTTSKMEDGSYGRNRRSVWTIPTQPCSMAHFAVMPEALVKPCILAGCPVGGTVLDPFGGSGTVGKVAEGLGRNSVLIELNPEYIELQKARTAQIGMAI